MLKSINISLIAIAMAASNPVLAQEVATSGDSSQIACLADAVYYEAKNQSRTGQIAIAHVVLNRVEDLRFPKTPCSVVRQKRGKTCQFSWFCSKNLAAKNHVQYQKAYSVAEYVYNNRHQISDVTYGSLFFHAKHARPGWKYKRTVTIGDHIFYRG
jgi:spore germination cell wall hydrolase CwlJ-like protein